MSDEFKKFNNLLKTAKNILIITNPQPNYDFITGMFALNMFLHKQTKKVTILNNVNKDYVKNLSFLKQPTKENFIKQLNGSRDFLLIFNTEKNKIINIQTEEKETKTIIRITPERGVIDPKDFSLSPADFKYDLIITLGIPSLEQLGTLYQKNTDLFFEIAKININNDSANEDYGQINLVDLTASSVSEILGELFLEEYEDLIDEKIAQSLLTGIISATDSFQKPNTTPQTLILASQLIKKKANQEEIIKHLYKTKPLSFLKLWGRTMARLNWDNSKKFIWSLLSIEDFLKSRAESDIIPMILDELKKNYRQGNIFGIFYNQDNENTLGEFIINNNRVLKDLADEYDTEPIGNRLKIFFPKKDLLKAEKSFSIALNKNL